MGQQVHGSSKVYNPSESDWPGFLAFFLINQKKTKKLVPVRALVTAMRPETQWSILGQVSK